MRKADLPFVCEDCSKTFPSNAAKEMHRKAKHKVRVHSFGDLKDMIEKNPQIVPGGSRPSGARRWLRRLGDLPAAAVVAIALFLGLAGSLVALKVVAQFDGTTDSANISNIPRPVTTTVIKPQQK